MSTNQFQSLPSTLKWHWMTFWESVNVSILAKIFSSVSATIELEEGFDNYFSKSWLCTSSGSCLSFLWLMLASISINLKWMYSWFGSVTKSRFSSMPLLLLFLWPGSCHWDNVELSAFVLLQFLPESWVHHAELVILLMLDMNPLHFINYYVFNVCKPYPPSKPPTWIYT